ncbi:MAG: UPF0175 family protein [Deltaproteobacteria bacterium]|nr:UPF0175 family protein [Deltaproteobacteria bacterium]
MGMRRIRIELELPEELFADPGFEGRVVRVAREVAVMDLLRDALISQDKAAEMLGVDRGQLVDIMNARGVPHIGETVEDLGREPKQLSVWKLGAPPNLTRKDYYDPKQ